jgi:hypothetical protein
MTSTTMVGTAVLRSVGVRMARFYRDAMTVSVVTTPP